MVHDFRPLAQSRRHLTTAAIGAAEDRAAGGKSVTWKTKLLPITRCTCGSCYCFQCWENVPFDIDGKQSLHFGGAAAYCRSKGLSLAVAEEKHLKHMGVVDGDATAGHLPVAVLKL